ncbi:phosphatase and actin regulator 3 [Bombina bombina]|uniref:phosphatase and actin regulator 3 n=1 Tax=Bombina bombina TaxID=8345 RepID=UPI00235B114A|nr:phosphatase and actin regulator 3 [Bombina bombina]
MAQSPALRSEYLVSGMRTPPARRNSKLATLGRIFKPWKWRKKKSEKLKQTSAALEKKISTRQSRDEFIKKGLLEIMEQDAGSKACSDDESTGDIQNDLSPPTCQALTTEEIFQELSAPVNANPLSEDQQPEQEEEETGRVHILVADDCNLSNLPSVEKALQALLQADSVDCPVLDIDAGQMPSPHLLPMPQPKAVSWVNQCVTGIEMEENALKSPPSIIMKSTAPVVSSHISGHTNIFQPSAQKTTEPHGQFVRGQHHTPTGSPHLPAMHMPLPSSRVIEELHRALATKHRQDSFHGRDNKPSPKKRLDFRSSRPSSVEKSKDNINSHDGDTENKCASVKESDENKENLIRDCGHNDDMFLYQDEEALNDSIISGTLPRKCKKELLAVKLRNRPSKQELEDRNIFPQRTDEERQEIRQQIEIKLSKRLSQRPAVEELERRNILKQRNDQTEQEERREIKQRLTRKLNQRPTVDELRERKILIRFSDYVEVAKAQDYDRRADKPWTRLSAADKAAIRKELNEYKSNEMEVHASSKHLTRYHRP